MKRIGHWYQSLLLAGFLAAATAAFAQPAALPADWPPNLRPALFPEWIDAAKQIKWPPRDGCAEATPVADTIAPGALIDRFGSEGGSYFSPVGQSFASRALPYVCSQMVYTTYRVKQPLNVQRCAAAPWFGEPGGAIQYKTAEPAYKLLASGMIEAAKNDATPDGKPVSPCGSP